MPDTPIVNAGHPYVNGLSLTRESDSSLSVSSGAARDSTNINDIVLESSVIVSTAAVGVNALDTGTVASDTMYHLYVIGDSTKFQATGTLLSLSSTAPNLPGGYDMFRRIGVTRTDGGSTDLWIFDHSGSGLLRHYALNPYLTLVTAGNATAFTPQSLLGEVAPVAGLVSLRLTFTASGATNAVSFAAYNRTNTDAIAFGTGVVGLQFGTIDVPITVIDGDPRFNWRVNDAAASVNIELVGFQDNL